MRSKFLFIILPLIVSGCQQPTSYSPKQIRDSLIFNIESQLPYLPPRIQGHYGLRMYRITGQEQYLPQVLVELLAVSQAQQHFSCEKLNSSDPAMAIKQTSKHLISKLGNGPRARARKRALQAHEEFIYYSDALLRYGSRIDALGFLSPCHEQMISALKGYDLLPALTDPIMIESWAAQLINYVYWAKQLGVADHIEAYKAAFMATYPDKNDPNLTDKQYRNKLYGLTHFIFAASSYYQQPVSTQDFAWIYDYFHKNIDKILLVATEDIIAEVGVSFKLAGLDDHPVVKQTQSHMIKQFNPEHQMILSPKGNPDMTLGEHRNMLAIMLFSDLSKLHKGPYLLSHKPLVKHLPKGLAPKPSLSLAQ